MRRGDDHVEDFEHGIGQIELAVLEDVDLDALEQRDIFDLLLDLRHLARLGNEALRVEPMDHGNSRRVIGDPEVAVAEGLRALRHLQHRRPAIAPVGVRVHVALVILEVEL